MQDHNLIFTPGRVPPISVVNGWHVWDVALPGGGGQDAAARTDLPQLCTARLGWALNDTNHLIEPSWRDHGVNITLPVKVRKVAIFSAAC